MGAHRRPPRPGRARMTAVTLAAAGATLAVPTVSSAEPAPTIAQTKEQVDRLYEQAEAATEQYNAATEKRGQLQRDITGLQNRITEEQERLRRAQEDLGATASARYRAGGVDPLLQMMLSTDPDRYLERAGALDVISTRQAASLRAAADARRTLDQSRAEATGRLAEIETANTVQADRKREVESKLAEANRILNRLEASERAQVLGQDGANAPATTPGKRPDAKPPTYTGPASGRAKAAIDFAYSQLGKPYVWGATGPDGYDCSGLTGAAWRAAGVSLPRTSQAQFAAGRKVARSDLQPGDLVYFYDDIHHVGLYIGDGKMIDAPRPGKSVQIASIDSMPWAGATRT